MGGFARAENLNDWGRAGAGARAAPVAIINFASNPCENL